MKHLWNIIDKSCKEDSKTAVFLGANIIYFTLLPLLAGIVICIITGSLPVINHLADIMLISIYVGIIFGLFGGIFHLMRIFR